MIPSWLSPKLAGIGILLLVLAGLYGYGWMMRSQRDTAREKLAAAQAQVVALGNQVAIQNAKVAAWVKEAAARTVAAQDAMAAAEIYQRQAATLRASLNAFKPTGDECHDLESLVDLHRAGWMRNGSGTAKNSGSPDPGSLRDQNTGSVQALRAHGGEQGGIPALPADRQ